MRVMQIKLTPDAKQSEALDAAMRRFNAACNWVAEGTFERQLANRFKLHKLFYYDVRNRFDLPANFACAVFARVAATLRRGKSGHAANADLNAALNIRRRAVANLPMVPAFY